MGRLMDGPKLQLNPSSLKRLSRAVDAKPRLPVSEMVGKNAARAAPTFARAARSLSSAARTSGRVTIRSEGDGKSVVEGKSVSVRVDRGGRRIIKKKNKTATN